MLAVTFFSPSIFVMLPHMATLVSGVVPAGEFALHHTLEVIPALEVECENIILSGENRVMPLLWVYHDDPGEIDTALEADPTVDNVTCLSVFDNECLYQME